MSVIIILVVLYFSIVLIRFVCWLVFRPKTDEEKANEEACRILEQKMAKRNE